MSDVPLAGIPWYAREHYAQLRRVLSDGSALFPDHAQWLAAARHSVMRMQAQGYRVIRVGIDPLTFPAWCRARGLEPALDARLEYAADVAERHAQAEALETA